MQCEVTGMQCREVIQIKAASGKVYNISPSVHALLVLGNSISFIRGAVRRFELELSNMTPEEEKEFFAEAFLNTKSLRPAEDSSLGVKRDDLTRKD